MRAFTVSQVGYVGIFFEKIAETVVHFVHLTRTNAHTRGDFWLIEFGVACVMCVALSKS